MNVPFLGQVPLDPNIVRLGDCGKAFVSEDAAAHSTQAFREVVANIQRQIVEQQGQEIPVSKKDEALLNAVLSWWFALALRSSA